MTLSFCATVAGTTTILEAVIAVGQEMALFINAAKNKGYDLPWGTLLNHVD